MLAAYSILQSRYRIVRQLGRGGMGAVYEAIDERLSRTVALKETLVETDELRRAFKREARLLANLNHPALPRVIDHFTEDVGQYLVMDYIPGDDLKALLENQKHPFSADDVLRWADELLDALDYLHTSEPPVIHRDIKPSNLKLTAKGNIILLDFGLAKGAAGQMTLATSSQSILGYSPHFAPLEQVQGEKTSPRSDLYALAATLYNLLTNRMPPDALTRATAMLVDEPDPLQPISLLNPAVPPSVSLVLSQALALRPAQRPASAAEMRAKLLKSTVPPSFAAIHDQSESTIIRQNNSHLAPQERRTWRPVWLVGAFVLVLGGWAIYSFILPSFIIDKTASLSGASNLNAPVGMTSPNIANTKNAIAEAANASSSSTPEPSSAPTPATLKNPEKTIHKFLARQAIGSDIEFQRIFYGDLDGDGNTDAVVDYGIAIAGSASGVLTHIAVFLNRDGDLVYFGKMDTNGGGSDTTAVRSIKNGKIICETLRYKESDARCCPSIKRRTELVLRDGELTRL